MSSDSTSKRTVLIVAGVVVALLLAGTLGWLARGREVRDLEDRVALLEDDAAEADGEDAEDAEESDDADDPDGADSAEGETADGTAETPATGSSGVTERQPGLILGVFEAGGAYRLTTDYVQFLTGDAAAAAAAARGDESPPPNDYYIVNENPRIREFPIRAGISVRVVVSATGGSVPEGRTMTLADWAAAMDGPDAEYYMANVYWITVTDGVVTALEQQYVP